ncbi:SRPBCC domain-containing protein [Streptomyces katsurahamanus]|uniref:Carbon monoxide dehydrogenase n=1 Tax=Streptomyces katsurahamanus TaxID=2577098 RepID=A0ABW9P0T9_9ACTN|nr:SRPBCC domain-containing protein [Streptomyces katsurahamanus]MQS39073.1 carbon monoxide dehydrogenase [Streptomyces katsurahamanus]
MDHQVFVPVPAEAVREVLRDPARVARCVRGLQQDADDGKGPLAGRLRVRAGSHTITYRGALRVVERGGDFAVEGEGAEARGAGSVRVALTVRLTETDGGTTLSVTGTAQADGRLAELTDDAREQAAHRLLDRFGERLAELAAGEGADAGPGSEGPGPVSRRDAERIGIAEPDETQEPEEAETVSGTGTGAVFDAPVPPPAPDAGTDDEPAAAEAPSDADADADAPGAPGDSLDHLDDLEHLDALEDLPDTPPAEAAHARRTMIGRSAEEVDHAPPRGRYAPVPAPDDGGRGLPLRWIAPAAALAIASAVVAGRALRRRR